MCVELLLDGLNSSIIGDYNGKQMFRRVIVFQVVKSWTDLVII